MSIASGRAWQAAGAGLGNIGRLLVEQEERERERQRQEDADRVAAEDRALKMAEYTDRTGISTVAPSAPTVEFTPPRFGASFPQAGARGPSTATSLGVALSAPGPGYLSGRGATPPTNEFAGIGAVAAATPTPRMRGLADTFQPGGFVKTAPSAAERTEIAAAQQAGRVGQTMAGLVPAVRAMTPEQQTLVGAGEVPLSVVNAAQERTDAHTEATGWLRKYPDIPPDIGDQAVNRAGQFREQQAHDIRPIGSTGPTPTDRRLTTVERAIDDARGAIATARGGLSAQAQRTGRPRTPTDSVAVREIEVQQRRLTDLTAEHDRLTGGSPTAQKRVVTADQRDYLQSIGAWDPTKYEVR